MGIAGGLIGLTANVGKREQAQRDIGTRMQMLNLKKQDEAEEQMAEAQYQDMIAKVQAEADGLLENDRTAINLKAKALQNDIRKKVKALGGSKSAFMKQGGISDLANYKKDLLSSNEYVQYKNNKTNMERILMLKEKGLGHLINEKDMAALNSYNTNGKGKITYTGVLNEIEVDEQAYEWGSIITPEQVLQNSSNRMKIIANWEADTGQDYNPTYDEEVLKGYIKYKGYGGVGRNTVMQIAKAKADAAKAKEKARLSTVSNAISSATSNVKQTAYADMESSQGYGFLSSENVSRLGAKKSKVISSTPTDLITKNLNRIPGIDNIHKAVFGNSPLTEHQYVLKGSANILSGKSGELMTEYMEGLAVVNEDGAYMADPTALEATYDAKGSKLTGRSSMRGWNNSYKPMEISLAYKGKDDVGNDILITDKYKDGKFDKEGTKEMYGDQGTPSGNGTMVVRMHDPKNPGFDYYQEIEANSVAHSKMLSNMMGNDNDLSKVEKEQRQYEEGKNISDAKAKKQMDDTKDLAVKEAVKMHKNTSETLDNNSQFDMIKKQYQTDTGNRDDLVKAYYQAASRGEVTTLNKALDLKHFDIRLGNYDLSEDMLNNEKSDTDIMNSFYNKYRKEESPIESYYFYNLWKEIYEKNINKNKQDA